MSNVLKAGTRVYAVNRNDPKVFVIGTTTDDHDFSPGALSALIIASGSLYIPDTFSIEINCSGWRVFELVGKN